VASGNRGGDVDLGIAMEEGGRRERERETTRESTRGERIEKSDLS
jgi:hypothetical protein